MKLDLTNPIGRVRLVGMLEGISFLLLLGIAMPLKYAFGMPQFVRYVGMAHGVLFILYLLLILIVWLERKISIRHAALAVVMSVVPFGPFWIDRKLAADEKSDEQGPN